MKKLLLFLLFVFATFKVYSQDVPTSEREALINFYDALDGDNWAVKTNWKTSAEVSTWTGITVRVIDDIPHVTEIKLFNNGLFGSIPESINLLSKLEVLTLTNAYVTNIPSSIGDITTLKSFTLEGVGFNSPLTKLPATMGNLNNLKLLNISNNSLKTLPSSFSALQNLENLNISFNRFVNFPNVITTLINLKTFNCNLNSNMKGVLPDSFKNLVNLSILKMQTGMYISNSDIFSDMTKLYELSLDGVETNGYLNLSNKQYLTYLILNGPAYTENLKVLSFKGDSVKSLYYTYLNTRFKCVEVDNPEKAKLGLYPYTYLKSQVIFLTQYPNNFSSDCSEHTLPTQESNLIGFKIQNPVKNILILQNQQKVNRIDMYSSTGQLIKSLLGDQRNISDVPSGSYILKIFSENKVFTQKIIKE